MTAPSPIGMSAEQLRLLIHYDPETGDFMRLPRKGGPSAPVPTGTYFNGYVRIMIMYKLYAAHRLAWLYMTGKEPVSQIDHINMNRSDNRWVNLREATPSQNIANQGLIKTNRSGFKGVTFINKCGRWNASITVNRRKIWLGSFLTPQEASQAYRAAAQKYFGKFARLQEIENATRG